MKNNKLTDKRTIGARIAALLVADSVPLSDAWGRLIDDAEKMESELQERRKAGERLQESAYKAGLTAGWNFGIEHNSVGFSKCLAAHEYAAPHLAPKEYQIGAATMRHVFKPAALTDVSDLQAVFDQVEKALNHMGLRTSRPISPLLHSFYIAYNGWVKSGAKCEDLFSTDAGLCVCAYDYFSFIGVEPADYLEEMHATFVSAGLNEKLPFNEDPQHYVDEQARNECHLNPARVAWVECHAAKMPAAAPTLDILRRLCEWDKRYPVNCVDGYAGLKALDEIIAAAAAQLKDPAHE
ncbi:hypothetical protein NFG91_004227 [Salmonella enterica]|nr:hypothetical protein [Salmonella enterica]EJI5362877.1 hypothetical protein [Salmonella enterica]